MVLYQITLFQLSEQLLLPSGIFLFICLPIYRLPPLQSMILKNGHHQFFLSLCIQATPLIMRWGLILLSLNLDF